MKKTITLSKYFFKKNIKDIISFVIILFIATILFSSAIIINFNVSEDYDKEADKLNTANSFFTIPSVEYTDNILNDIKNIKGIQEVEVQTGIMLTIPVNMEGAIQEQNQIFYNIDSVSSINKKEIIKETTDKIKYGIYLSNYTFIHSGLDIKDEYKFNVDNISYSFNIKGVVKEMQYGNYTSSVIGEYLESEAYNYLLENNKEKSVITISVKSKDSYSSYNDISKYLSSKNVNILSKNYKEQSKIQRLAISNILVLILMIFSSSILIISLFVSKFKIEQTIEEEISNMGALKALGYTSKEIIVSCIFPYIISGLLFTMLGIVASYFILPILSKVIEMQSGFIWKVKIDLSLNILVLLINIILITVFTLVASLKIKRLNPINAIRGITIRGNNKNYLEIEKTKGNIHFILMLKNFLNTKKQNILLGIMLFLMTIISSFIGILFYNVNMNPINFINTLVEEHPSVVISSKLDLRNELETQDNVKDVIYYDENITLNYKTNSYKTFVAENFKDLSNDLCYKGRNPVNSNEVAIGSKLEETYNINIGDYITLSKKGTENKYKVVGFIQSVNYSGEVIEMTLDGYKILDNSYLPTTMYIYLDNEQRTEEFINQVKSKYGNDIISTMNYAESMESATTMYISLVSIICIVIIAITLLLIYLILYIIISSIIIKRKQELGIFKAIGYENRELVKQLVGGFMPSTIIGTMLGLLVSEIFMRNIYNKIFMSVGAYKVSFEYPFIIFISLVILLIFATIIIATILAKKIKRISVYSLIKN